MANPGSVQITVVGATATGGTITSGGTYQTALAANPDRKGGFLQNNSASHVMYVFVGAGTPGHASSVQVPFGDFFNFNMGTTGFIYTGAIKVDGTTADAFTVVEIT